MANVQAAFGTIKGKIGNLRFSDWNGVNSVAQQPASYTDAKTVVQVKNRSTFKELALLGRQIIGVLRIGFSQYTSKTSPWAQFMKTNAGLFHVNNQGKTELTNAYKFMVAQGALPSAVGAGSSEYGVGKTSIIWDDNSASFGASPTDKAVVVAVFEEDATAFSVVTNAKRSDGTVIVTFPVPSNGQPAKMYLFFVSATDAKLTSDSVLAVQG